MGNFDKIFDRRYKGFVKWQKYENSDIIPMWVADMEFKSPSPILDKIKDKLEEGFLGYSYPPKEAYDSIIEYEFKEHNWKIKKDWIIFVPGLVSTLYAISKIFAKQDEGIATFIPIYPPFIKAPLYHKRKLKMIDLMRENQRYAIDFKKLKNQLTPNDKIFLFCNPHNPTGKVFDEQELVKFSQTVEEKNMLIVSDEIHCDIILNQDNRHIPIATVSEYALNNSITLQAPSKTYNIAGMNTAFVIIPNKIIREKFIQGVEESIPLVNVLGYQALIAAYNSGKRWKDKLLEYLRENMNIVYEFVKKFPKLKMLKPDATYLAWIDIRNLNLKNPIEYFERYGVGLSDGVDFGAEGFVRLNFGCSKAMLYKALERMKIAIEDI